jgi:hypothetical protein
MLTNSKRATYWNNSNINNIICEKSNVNIIAYNRNTTYEELGTAYDEPNTTVEASWAVQYNFNSSESSSATSASLVLLC